MSGGRGAAVAITVGAAAAIGFYVFTGVVTHESAPPQPQNKLTCSTMGAGWVTLYGANGKLVENLHIRSVKSCTWDFPSEWTSGGGTQTWDNPPTQVITWDGSMQIYPGDTRMNFSQQPIKIVS